TRWNSPLKPPMVTSTSSRWQKAGCAKCARSWPIRKSVSPRAAPADVAIAATSWRSIHRELEQHALRRAVAYSHVPLLRYASDFGVDGVTPRRQGCKQKPANGRGTDQRLALPIPNGDPHVRQIDVPRVAVRRNRLRRQLDGQRIVRRGLAHRLRLIEPYPTGHVAHITLNALRRQPIGCGKRRCSGQRTQQGDSLGPKQSWHGRISSALQRAAQRTVWHRAAPSHTQ